MRTAKLSRKTKETDISIEVNLDGSGKSKLKFPIGFFTHMLEAFSKHSLIDLTLTATGDLEVDQHHIVEDTGIVLGEALKKALGEKRGINRSGYFVFPMDEALAVVAIDLSGRAYLQFDAQCKRRFCGDFDTDLLEDFFQGFTNALQANVVVRMPYGRSDHHKIEAIFKAFAKAMKMAVEKEKRALQSIPSTKGVI